jgi:hypothetical protein
MGDPNPWTALLGHLEDEQAAEVVELRALQRALSDSLELTDSAMSRYLGSVSRRRDVLQRNITARAARISKLSNGEGPLVH